MTGSYKHPRLKVSERVRPIAAWRDALTPSIPTGVVTAVEPLGLGQLVWIDDHPKPYFAGMFERDDTAARPA